ncbi:MAG: hypothetical protein ABSA51_07795 [Anaerolineaceae bacterium]|jgi:hypothetical protein
MRSPLSTAIAIATGLIILIALILPFSWMQDIRTILLAPAIILSGVAGLIAIYNLLVVHGRKMLSAKERDIYSFFLLLGFLVTFIAGLILAPANTQFQHVVTSIQVPVEASLMGVLAVSLAYASVRLFQQRKGIMGFFFILSTIVFLVISSGFLSIGNNIPVFKDVLAVVEQLPVAGGRGILLGIALGGLTAGIRILLGADRPYSG